MPIQLDSEGTFALQHLFNAHGIALMTASRVGPVVANERQRVDKDTDLHEFLDNISEWQCLSPCFCIHREC